jgi:hypothetical protein
MTRKAFRIEEANAMIPGLNEVFQQVREHRSTIRNATERIDVLELLWEKGVRNPANPDHAEFLRLHEDVDRALRGLQRAVEEGVVARGLRFPTGGLENGLVDFPTTYRGRWVYLCWHVGEREIRYWHETDAGYPGRKEISDDDRERMGADDPEGIDDTGLDFPDV